MKLILTLLALAVYSFAEYQTGSIDMHGGKSTHSYDRKMSGFGTPSMGMSLYLDNNSSKKSEKGEKKKVTK